IVLSILIHEKLYGENNSVNDFLNLYDNKNKDPDWINSGWIIKSNNKQKIPPVLGSGSSAFFTEESPWKIHISINPDQLKEAIAIIVPLLLKETTPELGFKILNLERFRQTKKEYQPSKEIAINFPQT